jgi:hypothetical protein
MPITLQLTHLSHDCCYGITAPLLLLLHTLYFTQSIFIYRSVYFCWLCRVGGPNAFSRLLGVAPYPLDCCCESPSTNKRPSRAASLLLWFFISCNETSYSPFLYIKEGIRIGCVGIWQETPSPCHFAQLSLVWTATSGRCSAFSFQ